MKIGILVFGDKYGGGVYHYTQSLIDALKKDKFKKYIIFVNADDDRFDKYDLEVRKIEKTKSNLFQKIIRLFQFIFLIRKSLFFTKKEIEIFEDIDLFLSPSVSPYPYYFANKPFIFTLHDMQERYHPEFFTLKERIVRFTINRALSKTATKIICESIFVKNDIMKFLDILPNKIEVIPSPPPSCFAKLKIQKNYLNKIKSKYKLPEKFLFYPAQFWYHKNHINLIRAVDLISKKYKQDINLVLVGSKKNNFENTMNEIKKLALGNQVKYLGYVSDKDISYLYKLSTALVMPTLFESVSMPIWEAFYLGCPVISSNVCALPEQVGDAGLLFNPNNIGDMAEKICRVWTDKNLRREFVKKGNERIKNFTLENYAKQWDKIINEVLKK